ncbi:MAG TPA: DUF2798 domain-containing protein [Sulfurovum sp.]|nr:DUF2798 domain-containing protein [Sulfurovum sp.]
MRPSILYRVIFTLILSGIMSASMTYMVSSFYCEPHMHTLVFIWLQAWITAFTVIFILSPLLHTLSSRLTGIIKELML